MNMPKDILEINEVKNLIDNLKMVKHFLETSLSFKWKWVIIALHQALYGALISILKGTDHRQTVINREGKRGKAITLHIDRVPINEIASRLEKSEEQIQDWITNPHLISLNVALERVKQKEYLPLLNTRILETTPEEDQAIERLTEEFRNNFEHFTPKVWIIDTTIMPSIVTKVLRVISFLIFESNCINLSKEEEIEIKIVIEQVKNLLPKSLV